MKRRCSAGLARRSFLAAVLLVAGLLLAVGCSNSRAHASSAETPQAALSSVGVTTVTLKPIGRTLTVSSELVPFQEIDVYAKESGYVSDLRVDYGSRVKKGDLMAVLEIPELKTRLAQDAAAIQRATDQVTHAEHEVSRIKATYKVAHLEYVRLSGVAQTRPGLVAQQEIDDAEGKDLSTQAQVEAGESALLAAQSQLDVAKAQAQQDQILYDYARITAPFAGVVTQRYANLGTLMQAGTSSSTQAMPLVRLSQDDLFRLVIPVPESYVKYIKVGDAVSVRVPSLDKSFPGRVTRFSVDVSEDTRTMHTEVDIPNPSHILMPGLYADATLTLEHRDKALVVPLNAVTQTGDAASVFTVDQNDRLQNRDIRLGMETASEAEVLSGLNEGDRVVVSDRSGLKPGTQVRPQTVEVLQYQGESN
ncbi:MAG: efflux RND transporter periplasmic adaptor subunit [Acidobacteria bacterium]|nr:efflux RND transporter periplasmic adaptor subunit [Acidobacteriota bacterium]